MWSAHPSAARTAPRDAEPRTPGAEEPGEPEQGTGEAQERDDEQHVRTHPEGGPSLDQGELGGGVGGRRQEDRAEPGWRRRR
ncbi:hypothetical protein ACFSTC_00570 [Nonomuraea ferruginea]